MSQTPNDNQDRLEQMLRRWGAEEAAEQVEVGPPPALPGRRRASAIWRWGPVAAAAALLIAACGLLLLRPIGGRPSTEAIETRRSLSGQADRSAAVDEVAALERRLAESERQLNDVRAARQADKDAYEKVMAAALGENAKMLGELSELQAEIQRKLAAKDAALAAANTKAARLAKQIAAAGGRDDITRKRLKAATDELASLVKRQRQAELARRGAEKRLAEAASRHRATMARLQRRYLALAGQGHSGLAARQVAARQADLLVRLRAVRAGTNNEGTRRLLARLEVALTRLDMMDPSSAAAAEGLARMVREGGFAKRIDAALSALGESEAVMAWLLEARLILTGGDGGG